MRYRRKNASYARRLQADAPWVAAGGPTALDTFDLLTPMVDWVEKGTAPPSIPPSITATGKPFPGRSRPLCAYPAHAHYKGQGDPEDANNFDCTP